MTVDEFTEQQAALICRHCQTRGRMITKRNENNGGLAVRCDACGGGDPIGGVPFLSQSGSRRRPVTADLSLNEVWVAWGDRCAGCGADRTTLSALGIGRHRQHAPPLETVDNDQTQTTLIPLCALCHEHVTANQRALRAIVRALAARLNPP